MTLNVLQQYIEDILARRGELPAPPASLPSVLDAHPGDLAPEVKDLFDGFYLEMVAVLGRRTAEMHLALAANVQDPVWRPEEFSTLYQRSVYQSMRSMARRNFLQLQRSRDQLRSLTDRELADRILAAEKEILEQMARIMGRKITAFKTRIHGDYHLGQVLFTGKDFVIIDFEGEPARTMSERRLKRSPLRDVAGMIRSFHYAAQTALRRQRAVQPAEAALLEPWADLWSLYISSAFLEAYRGHIGEAAVIPHDPEFLEIMLSSFLLEKAVYELGYELNNRPDWVGIPLRGIDMMLKGIATTPR